MRFFSASVFFCLSVFSCGVRWVDIPETVKIYVNTTGRILTEKEKEKYPSKIEIPYKFYPKTRFNSVAFFSENESIVRIVSSRYAEAVAPGKTVITAVPKNKTYGKDTCLVHVLPVP